ncbi:MAG: aspartyl protease family protein [Bacteroidales bacterium]|nr:aspartyl protease family protein [Bacteroidales bacterium]
MNYNINLRKQNGNRKTFSLFILVLFIVSCWSVDLAAQDEYEPSFYFTDSTQTSMSMPFELVNNLVIIPVNINFSEQLKLILDTGVPVTIITRLYADDTVSLRFARKQKINGLGEGDPVEAYHAERNHFRIDDIESDNQELYVLLKDLFEFSQKMGMKIHGLIGYHVFKNFILEFDFESKFLSIHQPGHYEYKKSRRNDRVTLPMQIIDKKPYITTDVIMADGTRVPVKLLIDSGGGFALWLSPQSDERITLPEKIIDGYLGVGLNGDIFGKKGRIEAIELGPFTLKEPITSFPDSASVTSTINRDGRNGSIGAKILNRFNMIIDYPNKKITLISTDRIDEPFDYNRSGIEIIAPIPGLNAYTVSHVRDGSPADKAGIKENDQLISVNYRRSVESSIGEMNEMLYGDPGKRLRVIINRNGERMKFKFRLKKVL